MAIGGEKLSRVLSRLAPLAKPGVTTLELDTQAQKLILATGGKPSFQMVPGYLHTTCLTVNDEVVHGIPTHYKLKSGDILGIDIGLFYQGFHSDTSVTVPIGTVAADVMSFLESGRESLKKAVSAAIVGKTVWHVSRAMEIPLLDKGFSPVKSLTGHGIGKDLHEEPAVPCFSLGDSGHSTQLQPGLCLAIETIYNQGRPDITYKNDDNWTISTRDGSLSAVFEVTIAITPAGTKVLTPLRC